ncbi:MAG: hypothetical protein EXR71_15870 [Myxococcales bacterium]|nr:hypothetical protein [Myxococcales bacterium]
MYDFDVANATIEEPSGLESVLSSNINQSVLMEVAYADAASLDFLVGLSIADDPTVQDYCTATTTVEGASFVENPSFDVGPTELSMVVAGYAVYLTDVYFSGTFAADMSEITDGSIAGVLDTRPLDDLAGGKEGAVCQLAAMMGGASCVACADGEEFCLELLVTKIQAPWLDKTDLSEVAGNLCEGCEDGPPAPDAVCI